MCKNVTVPLAILFVIFAGSAADDAGNAPGVPVIEEVTGFRMTTIRRQGFGRNRPQTFENAKDLVNAMGEEAAKKIVAAVDFEEQFLVFFQWSGSGRDKLSFRIAQTEEGTRVVFKYTPGRTKDLRPHARLYVIRRGVAWEVGPKDSSPRLPRRKHNR
jgi:hypothetical protein